jgi:hypothetical protein
MTLSAASRFVARPFARMRRTISSATASSRPLELGTATIWRRNSIALTARSPVRLPQPRLADPSGV